MIKLQINEKIFIILDGNNNSDLKFTSNEELIG